MEYHPTKDIRMSHFIVLTKQYYWFDFTMGQSVHVQKHQMQTWRAVSIVQKSDGWRISLHFHFDHCSHKSNRGNFSKALPLLLTFSISFENLGFYKFFWLIFLSSTRFDHGGTLRRRRRWQLLGFWFGQVFFQRYDKFFRPVSFECWFCSFCQRVFPRFWFFANSISPLCIPSAYCVERFLAALFYDNAGEYFWLQWVLVVNRESFYIAESADFRPASSCLGGSRFFFGFLRTPCVLKGSVDDAGRVPLELLESLLYFCCRQSKEIGHGLDQVVKKIVVFTSSLKPIFWCSLVGSIFSFWSRHDLKK